MPASYISQSSCSESVSDLAVDVDLLSTPAKQGGEGAAKESSTVTAAAAALRSIREQEKKLSLDEICRLTRFSRKEVRSFYRTLKQECPRGVVSEDVLREVYNRLFPEGNGGLYAKSVFRTLDTQGNGLVTFTQLLVFLSTISKGTYQDRLRWVFQLYDVDGDGAIQPSELFTLILAIREMAGMTEQNYHQPEHSKKRSGNKEDVNSEKVIKAMNEKRRNELREQARLHAEKLFERWDLNKDGLVTWDEFLACCLRDENLETSFNYFDSVY